MESFQDECPKCGVYVSKYLAAQQRQMQAVHGATFSDSRPPPPGGFLHDTSVSLPPMAKGWNTQSIVVWSMVAVVLGLVGWVVLVDWFGDACAYAPPPGWQAIDDETVEKATEGAAPQWGADMEVHDLFSPGGSTTAQSAILIAEIDRAMPMDERTLAEARAKFESVKAQPLLAGTKITAAATRIAGLGAIEIEVQMKQGPMSVSLLSILIGASRSTFLFLFLAPTAEYRAQIDAVRASLGSFRVLRPQGLRGNPIVKHGLRWGWILGVLIAGAVLFGRLRGGS
jgi:hypothetical protein